ncbi:MAG: DUF4292 domain-containing protein [Chlorobi bacterium]|nr:DUF4292 domain-containing protein [Chlorobiota bacterium]
MMTRIIALLLVLCTFVLQSGCADFDTVTREERPALSSELTPELADLYREVAEASPSVRSLDGYADVSIKTPRKKGKVYCNIQLKRHQESRMIVTSGILGWPVADLYFGRDSLFVHDMMGDRLLAGKNNTENLEKILGVPSGYRLLSESLLGLVNLDEPVERVSGVKKGNGRVMYVFDHNGTRKEVVIDPGNRTLTALFITPPSGDSATAIHFRNFQPFVLDARTVLIPRQIEMTLSRNGQTDQEEACRLVIDYDKQVINPKELSIRFVRPGKARVISLEEIGELPWM